MLKNSKVVNESYGINESCCLDLKCFVLFFFTTFFTLVQFLLINKAYL